MAETDEEFEILEPLPDDEEAGLQPVENRRMSIEVEPELVTCVGQDLDCLPGDFIRVHGPVARRLDLSYNKLSSLDGLAEFMILEHLVLDNNELTDASLQALPTLPLLHTLTLNKNKICDIDVLLSQLTRNCPSLRYLSLLGNQACPNELLGMEHDDEDYQRYSDLANCLSPHLRAFSLEGLGVSFSGITVDWLSRVDVKIGNVWRISKLKYRYYVLYKLPDLTFLDSRAVTAREKADAKRKGQFTRVVKPEAAAFEEQAGRSRMDYTPAYTPLPQSVPVTGQHRAVFGQCKYVYYGKHSEGNRFIRNNQL